MGGCEWINRRVNLIAAKEWRIWRVNAMSHRMGMMKVRGSYRVSFDWFEHTSFELENFIFGFRFYALWFLVLVLLGVGIIKIQRFIGRMSKKFVIRLDVIRLMA